MPPSRGSRIEELDRALLVLRRLWQRPEITAFFRARLDRPLRIEYYRTLTAIERSPHRPSVGELADVLGVDPSTASRLVDRMASRGYVRREEDTDDRRRSTLELTPLGQSVLRKLREVRVAVLAELTKDWKASEIADLARLLVRLDEAAARLGWAETPAGSQREGPLRDRQPGHRSPAGPRSP